MKNYIKLQCLLAVFLLCFLNVGYNAQKQKLNEGDVCQKGDRKTANYICRRIENCPVSVGEMNTTEIQSKNKCSSNGTTNLVCCPPESNDLKQISNTTKKPTINPVSKSYSAKEMCEEYSKLIYFKRKKPSLLETSEEDYVTYTDCYDPITILSNATAAEPKEFPHMVLLGYSVKPDFNFWFCGGSLISKRFVLTAAHCEKYTNIDNVPMFANLARLGELDYSSETDIFKPKDYKIIERIIHPNYKLPSQYNDIALFRLEIDVEFSAFVRPICLNTDNMLTPPRVTATGWGKIDGGEQISSHLLKKSINTVSEEECDRSLLHILYRNKKIAQGIVYNSMLCTGNSEDGNDTCGVDSGGPIKIVHTSHKCMYSQIGITSFGLMCGYGPTIYTRVSNYISWIENIVWPKTYLKIDL